VVTELFVDVYNISGNGTLASCECDASLVLTANVTVLMVWAGTAPLKSVNAVLRLTLGCHGVDVTSQREHRHVLGERALGSWFEVGTFNFGRIVLDPRSSLTIITGIVWPRGT